MWVFMLGFLGFPLTGGFSGKIYVFAAAYEPGWWWLIVVGVVGTMVSAAYYLAVVRAMFLRDSAELQLAPAGGSPPRDPGARSAPSALCLVVTVGSFFFVQPLIDVARLGRRRRCRSSRPRLSRVEPLRLRRPQVGEPAHERRGGDRAP